MLRQLLHGLPRSATRRRSVGNPAIPTPRTHNAQFISYLVESGSRQVNADHYESSLRRRHAFKSVLLWLVGAGLAWVVLESARALSIY
jgi:hypothetical protein